MFKMQNCYKKMLVKFFLPNFFFENVFWKNADKFRQSEDSGREHFEHEN